MTDGIMKAAAMNAKGLFSAVKTISGTLQIMHRGDSVTHETSNKHNNTLNIVFYMRVRNLIVKRLLQVEEDSKVCVIHLLTPNIWEYMFKRKYLLFGHACILSCVNKHLRQVMINRIVFEPTLDRFAKCRSIFSSELCQLCWLDNIRLIPAAWNWHLRQNPLPVCHACLKESCWEKTIPNDTYKALWKAFCSDRKSWKWHPDNIESSFDVHPLIVEAFFKECVFPKVLPNLGSALVESCAKKLVKIIASKASIGDKKESEATIRSILTRTPFVACVMIESK